VTVSDAYSADVRLPTSSSTSTRTPISTSTTILTGTPVLTSTATPTATATPYPQPNVAIPTAADTPGRLRVTLTARDAACGPNNMLFDRRFGSATNAQVVAGDGVLHGRGFLYPLLTPARQVTFYLVRQTTGQASTVNVTAVDGCGAWPSFIGGGRARSSGARSAGAAWVPGRAPVRPVTPPKARRPAV
jgi:hypothetical protein